MLLLLEHRKKLYWSETLYPQLLFCGIGLLTLQHDSCISTIACLASMYSDQLLSLWQRGTFESWWPATHYGALYWRDKEMAENAHEYANTYKDNGVIIVGKAHVPGIVKHLQGLGWRNIS